MPTGSAAAASSSPGALLMVVAGVAFALTELGAAADPRRDDRRDLADRQRGRAVPRRRAGRPVADRSPTPGGPRRSPGTTSSATSRPRPGRSLPGLLSQALLDRGSAPVDAYRAIVIGYAVIGIVMAVGFWRLGAADRGAARGDAATTGSGGASGSVARGASSCGCRSSSRSTRSAAGSSRRA